MYLPSQANAVSGDAAALSKEFDLFFKRILTLHTILSTEWIQTVGDLHAPRLAAKYIYLPNFHFHVPYFVGSYCT